MSPQDPREPAMEADIAEYMKEKERIRDILGRLGGVPGRTEKVLNTVFFLLVAISFIAAVFLQEAKDIPVDIAVLLISLKLILLLRQNAKVNHFQFWMLSTIEWRVNEIAAELKKANRSGDEATSS